MSTLIAIALMCTLPSDFGPGGPVGTKRPSDPEFDAVVRAFSFPGVDTTVEWADCGVVNAFYYYAGHRVVMCNELRGAMSPGAIRYVAAHELSHGVIDQLNVPYTTHNEGAADELASLMLIWMGRSEDVYAGASFWLSLGRDENPTDDHYGDLRRAWNLLCLATGADDTLPENACTYAYRRATWAWVRLLHLDV